MPPNYLWRAGAGREGRLEAKMVVALRGMSERLPRCLIGKQRKVAGDVGSCEMNDRSDLSLSRATRESPIVICDLLPRVEGGHPIKREVGDTLEVCATVFKDGHDRLSVVLLLRRAGEEAWQEHPMTLENPGLDLWRGACPLTENARYEYTIKAWTDVFASFCDELAKKVEAGVDVANEVMEGRELVVAALARAGPERHAALDEALREFDLAPDTDARTELLLSSDLEAAMAACPDQRDSRVFEPLLEVIVDRVIARFAAWYEMFPRSQGTEPGKSATFRECERRLPEIRDMGFDVLYLPPIHPIGRIHRKGPNNTLAAGPEDPGSPYAIGSDEGGHCAVHPELGTLEDFDRFVAAVRDHGMEVALDFAIQCAPDHPWVTEYPEWFVFRPDGSIKHAENPPKKYQDIVNVNFYCDDREGLWRALCDVVLFWAGHGVRIFRVDNPHTKPVPFWRWLIRTVQDRHPDVIFLSEAFTRPPMLRHLAKIGFSQSYTYFTWRNFKHELTEYGTELGQTEVREYLRPNFFANTPDILSPFLQTGGRPAFVIRLVLAGTMSSLYGIYSGFELCENTAVPGTEEYLNSEKYEIRTRDWSCPGHIKDVVARLNAIRRENPALHEFENLRFYAADDDNVIFYGKMTPERDNIVFVAVNFDPFEAHETGIVFPLGEMGIGDDQSFTVEELLGGDRHLWSGAHHRLRLDPQTNPAAIFRIGPWEHVEFESPCD